MDVIVLGGGVIGVTSAYYLAKQGASVHLFERQGDVAQETSFANAGQISPGYSTPWAAPGIPQKAAKWLFQKHAPLAIRPDGTAFQALWLKMMLQNCTARRYAINKERMMRVAEYSRDCLDVLRDETGIDYEQRQLGVLQLFRKQEQMDTIDKDTDILKDSGVDFERLDKDGVLACEPALAYSSADIVGGLRLPNDQTGDCRIFTHKLAQICQKLGVCFEFNANINRLQIDNGKITGVWVDDELHRADRYVVALGSYSRQFLQPLGLSLPVYPLKGYSLTVAIEEEKYAPVSTVLDETYKIALTRFDNRLRVGGMAEVAGFDLSLNPKRRDTLEMVATELFPCGTMAAGKFWTGLRPMTPDGTPIIGHTNFDNLFINTGHGTLGWTMACGSASLLGDIMMGKTTAISLEGLALDRYR